jgi:sialate O-acetylesterase
MNKRPLWIGLAVVGLLAGTVGAQEKAASTNAVTAKVRPASLFTDHMVLQQGMPVPVWGTAQPGDTVTVELALPGPGAAVVPAVSATADANGAWRVTLAPLKASNQPMELRLTSAAGAPAVILADVVVGEVWIASGQSNMAFALNESANASTAIAAAHDPLLRHFGVGLAVSTTRVDLVSGTWVVCSTNSAYGFSAVAYFFGRDLRKALGVPVGLIRSAVGGTPAQAWTSQAGFDGDPELGEIVTRYEKEIASWDPAQAEQEYRERLATHSQVVMKATSEGKPVPRVPRAPVHPAKATRRPMALYNGMIAPLQPYAIRGVIWYQGEADNGQAIYRRLFPALIASWRQAWGYEFPFFFVQLAPYVKMKPETREIQLDTWRTVPQTAMAVITDVGDATDIHPRRKEPVGARLALAARALVYGEKIEYSGPLYESFTADGGRVTLRFTHAGSGLKAAEGGVLKGFAVAGTNKVFAAAEAVIEGSSVVVRSPDVPAPVAVRYGWANVPDGNLVNGEGLPASPFRTDAWAEARAMAAPK